MSARWRKTPRPRGLAGIGFNQGFELRDGRYVLLRVSAACNLGEVRPKGWYWAGLGQNSCQSLKNTAELAKADADAWYKAHKVASKQ